MALVLNGDGKISGANLNIDSDGAATFTGLTVDTSTLSVDAVNNRVGIGTTTPYDQLTLDGGNVRIQAGTSTKRRVYTLPDGRAYSLGTSGGAAVVFERDASNNDEIAFETHWNGNSHQERMRINKNGYVTMPYQPSFSARIVSSFTTTNATIPFTVGAGATDTHNIGGHYNTSTYRFTAPVTGSYQFNVTGFTYNSTDAVIVLRKNGSNVFESIAFYNNTGNYHSLMTPVMLLLNTNDYVEVVLTAGGGVYGSGGQGFRFSGFLIG